MKTEPIFRNYELLADRAEQAFRKIAEAYPQEVKCELHCDDCCHAVFGLFLIEAAYLKYHFDRLGPEAIREAILRCSDAERALRRLEVKLQRHEDDAEMQSYVFAMERVRCPLLNDNKECALYEHRPITCRVYGIPTRVNGRTRACSKCAFEKDKSYQGFDLDQAYRELFLLSQEFLRAHGKGDPEKAGLLISVPRVLTSPVELIISETFV